MRLKTIGLIVAVLILTVFRFPQTVSAQTPASCDDEYTVQAGDWLSKIAEKYFGDILAYNLLTKNRKLCAD